jgi:hypothetical protein
MAGQPFLARYRLARRVVLLVAGRYCRGASPPSRTLGGHPSSQRPRDLSWLPSVIVYVYVHGRHIALHVQTRETWTDMDKQTITVRDGLPLRARSAQNRRNGPGESGQAQGPLGRHGHPDAL